MSGKAVDLGPMSLPVGEDAVDLFNGLVARQSDVLRLKQLLADGGQRQSGGAVPDIEEGTVPLMPASDMTIAEANVLIQLAEALPGMAPPKESSAIHSVQLQLNSDLLPNTTLTAFESAGRLHFEIRIHDLSGQSWLSSRLPWLVLQVGGKLGRPIRVVLLASNANGLPSTTIDWPEGEKT